MLEFLIENSAMCSIADKGLQKSLLCGSDWHEILVDENVSSLPQVVLYRPENQTEYVSLSLKRSKQGEPLLLFLSISPLLSTAMRVFILCVKYSLENLVLEYL